MLTISILNAKQNLRIEHPSGPLEFGRGPQRPGVPRCQVEDRSVSRNHLGVEELPGGRVRLRNLSQRLPVTLADGTFLEIGEVRDLTLPLHAILGETSLALLPLPNDQAGGVSSATLRSAETMVSSETMEFIPPPKPVQAGGGPAGSRAPLPPSGSASSK